MEKELKVAALRNGTVIDHLPPEQVFKVVSLLHLDSYKNQITVGNNLDSKLLGSKGIIKIADKYLKEDEINKIALIAPGAKINIIRNYQVIEKRQPELPEEIKGILRCINPKCITNNQPVGTRFHVIGEGDAVLLKCHYCEREIIGECVKVN
jgi:aspartate carbamoyltransferase regulatory subunit